MRSITRRSAIAGIGAAALTLGRSKNASAKDYDVGVTDTEIKLGTTSPYSGPASAYGVYGQAQSAYFEMVNDRGGINGRKINLISLDNAAEGRRANPQARRIRRGLRHRRISRHAAKCGGVQISQCERRAEPVPYLRCGTIQRSEELPLDRSVLSFLRRAGRGVRQVSPED
jgi:hypothetical protein